MTPRKIELVLQKGTPGLKWASWGKETIGPSGGIESGLGKDASSSSNKAEAPASTGKTPSLASSSAPAYPTSSKSGPKNWDKVGEADEDDEASQDVNYFFKKLYSGATPEQQRAMMKSFTESNGTSLSTNWDDVKDGKVETIPPKGVEEKKW